MYVRMCVCVYVYMYVCVLVLKRNLVPGSRSWDILVPQFHRLACHSSAEPNYVCMYICTLCMYECMYVYMWCFNNWPSVYFMVLVHGVDHGRIDRVGANGSVSALLSGSGIVSGIVSGSMVRMVMFAMWYSKGTITALSKHSIRMSSCEEEIKITMWECMYVCTSIFAYVCMYAFVYVCIRVCTICTNVYVCVCLMYVCMYVCMYGMYVQYVCMYTWMVDYPLGYLFVCMYVCMYVCVRSRSGTSSKSSFITFFLLKISSSSKTQDVTLTQVRCVKYCMYVCMYEAYSTWGTVMVFCFCPKQLTYTIGSEVPSLFFELRSLASIMCTTTSRYIMYTYIHIYIHTIHTHMHSIWILIPIYIHILQVFNTL